MPHFRVDDALHSHPKAQRAGDEALGMWSRAGSFCMAYLTDGFVPEWWVKQQPKGMAKAKRLIAAGLWHGGAEHEGEKGFQFHEFVGPGRQDSRAQIEADREKWRKKKQRQRDSNQESPSASPGDMRGVSPGDRAGDTRGESRVYTQHQPNPEEISGYVAETASLSNARDSIAATPGADLVRELIPSTIPGAEQTMLRIKASALLREGHTREDLSDALRLYLAKPHLGAGALPSLLSEVVRSRAAPSVPTINAHDDKVNGYLAFANQSNRREIEQ